MTKPFPRDPSARTKLVSKASVRGLLLSLALVAQTACLASPPGGDGPYAGEDAGIPVAGGGGGDYPQTSPPSSPADRNPSKDILLFAGTGTWDDEVAALQKLFDRKRVNYDVVSSADLDSMSVDDLSDYGLVVFPGGYGGRQTSSLASETHARLRAAVQERGLGYVGFCAGAFMAVAPTPGPGEDASYGLGVVSGPVLDYYYLENQGVEASIEKHRFADGRSRGMLWYGGPVTLNIPGSVVARYTNGDAAISQVWSGKGMVILSATHPVIPTYVKDDFGLEDSDGEDTDVAWQLIDAVLRTSPLATFR